MSALVGHHLLDHEPACWVWCCQCIIACVAHGPSVGVTGGINQFTGSDASFLGAMALCLAIAPLLEAVAS